MEGRVIEARAALGLLSLLSYLPSSVTTPPGVWARSEKAGPDLTA